MAGRLSADPESVETRTSTRTTLRIATNEKSEPEFHSVILWGAQAQTASLYLKKGSKVLIQGRIHTSHWSDKDGVEHLKYEIEAFNFQFLDSRSSIEEAA